MEGNSRIRLGVVGIIVMMLFSGLFARLWFLQVASSTETAAAQTRANRVRIITEPGVRGSILDRNGLKIVENKLVDSIQVRHGMTKKERAITVPNLAKLLGMKPKEVVKIIDDVRYSPYQPVPLKDEVDFQTLVYIKEHPEEFPKVQAVRRSIRVYTDAAKNAKGEPLAPHFLGYVGAINKHEQKLHEGQGYANDDVIGKDGAEQVFETQLRGGPHVRKLEVDSRGRLTRVLEDTPATVGNDVQLTMDLNIQRIAEESLQQGIEKAGGIQDTSFEDRFQTFRPSGGAAVVLNVSDGSVVALASNPTFPVNEFTNGLPAARFKELNDPKNHFPLLNRAVQGLYAPASTFKLFTSIAALENNITNPEEVIQDRGFVIFGSEGVERKFANAGETPHGTVRLVRGITISSDVYFYIMGFRFFEEWNKGHEAKGFGVQSVARRFGLGKPTGIGLANEARGRIPDDRFKKSFNRDNPDKFAKQWLPGDSANIAVGQGDVLVTPLQLATAYGAFANGGKIFQPRMADKVLTPGSQSTLRDLPAQMTSRITLKPEIRNPILEGLLGVTHSVEGTAQPAFSDYSGMDVAGKTGTAEQKPKQDNALFVGLVNPNPKPEQKCINKPGGDRSGCQYVVVVVVEQGGFGGSVAAPIARRIIESINGNTEPDPVRLRPRPTD